MAVVRGDWEYHVSRFEHGWTQPSRVELASSHTESETLTGQVEACLKQFLEATQAEHAKARQRLGTLTSRSVECSASHP